MYYNCMALYKNENLYCYCKCYNCLAFYKHTAIRYNLPVLLKSSNKKKIKIKNWLSLVIILVTVLIVCCFVNCDDNNRNAGEEEAWCREFQSIAKNIRRWQQWWCHYVQPSKKGISLSRVCLVVLYFIHLYFLFFFVPF